VAAAKDKNKQVELFELPLFSDKWFNKQDDEYEPNLFYF